MKERPILFSGAMVRAILEGRKTQTRRVVTVRGEQPPAWATFASEGHSLMQDGKPRPVGSFYWSEEQQAGKPLKTLRRWPVLPEKHPMAGDWYWTPSPYGKISDRLWVREAWQHSNHPLGPYDADCLVHYRADYIDDPHGPDGEKSPEGKYRVWRPSIHMPRAASRITLEITGVRVERLQSISEADAISEGIEVFETDDPDLQGMWRDYSEDGMASGNPIGSFLTLWDGINAARGYGWEANPWVWALEFRRIER
ncbi:hypothetical protein [Burkholderia sp. B21-005]|uniref:hypothetical protein n=1 Tax=Burkholderia sp. B21-005 TaxID=2890406 RepID=UPI001E35538D|nr:hypothetical protein [Burkholderia sp. B21-005]UEP42708.1 hypothetical protein LMA02_07070 [Burkholderia sp. B21-005]